MDTKNGDMELIYKDLFYRIVWIVMIFNFHSKSLECEKNILQFVTIRVNSWLNILEV